MCGRYTHMRTWREIAALYRLTIPQDPPDSYRPDYNTSPTHVVPVIRMRRSGDRELMMAVWSLIPHWLPAKQLDQQSCATFNTRCETIREKRTFRDAYERYRGLMPADSYFEWQKLDRNGDLAKPGTKPHTVIPLVVKPTRPFSFGCIFDIWANDDREPIVSCSIVTTAPPPSLAHVHHRAPLIFHEESYDDWMTLAADDVEAMMTPYAGDVEMWEVGKAVGDVGNNNPAILKPVTPTPRPQPTLL